MTHGGMRPGDLGDEHRRLIVRLYKQYGIEADYLPYTPEFGKMIRHLHAAGLDITRRDLARLLIRMRKADPRQLPKLPRKSPCQSVLDRAQCGLLIFLYGKQRASTSDFLAYTSGFDRIASEFRRQTGIDWDDVVIYREIFLIRKRKRLALKGHLGGHDDQPDLFGGAS